MITLNDLRLTKEEVYPYVGLENLSNGLKLAEAQLQKLIDRGDIGIDCPDCGGTGYTQGLGERLHCLSCSGRGSFSLSELEEK